MNRRLSNRAHTALVVVVSVLFVAISVYLVGWGGGGDPGCYYDPAARQTIGEC